MRRRVVLVGVALAVQAVATSALLAADPSGAVASLRPGQHAFWQGGSTTYPLDIDAGGATLRVAVDSADCCSYTVQLVDPGGEVVTTADGYLSAEAYVDRPVPGRWQVRVSTDDRSLRLRAKLERAAAGRASAGRPLLPNLRLVPPYQFTFMAGIGTPGTSGCNPDDAAEFGCRRGLRFSLGPANTGSGPFQLRFAELEGVVVAGKVYQRIYDAGGTFTEREAGEFEYHKTHQHYHHTGFGSLELLRVTDPARGAMVPAGSGPKQGFCTADVVIFDWHAFDQSRQDSTASECVNQMLTPLGTYGPLGTLMGVSPGWADIYLWSQDGNYVEFGDNPDGRYVVRSTADALGHVAESDETDNTSYAYIEVAESRVKVLERGFGQGPFDRAKRLATDRVHLTVG